MFFSCNIRVVLISCIKYVYLPKKHAMALRYQQLGMTSRHGSVELLALNAKVHEIAYNRGRSGKSPYFGGKSRLVKYSYLARYRG